MTLLQSRSLRAFVLLAPLFLGLLPAAAARLIPPASVDPEAINPDARHFVVAPAAPLRNELFVFFPGSGGLPVNYTEVVTHAAALGYHAIALSYVNDDSINFDLCAFSGDPDCHAHARREIKEGIDLSDAIEVGPADSIDGRLAALLAHLEAGYPEENWGQFLNSSGGLNWSQIAVAGHSQGAGHAGFIAKNHAVARAVLFAGADVIFGQGEPAPWVRWPSATPASKIYGFTHTLDQTPSLEISREMWTAYGLDAFGQEVVVEDSETLSGHHRLTTNLEPSDPQNYHGATVVDRALPRGPGGINRLIDAWTHLLTDVRTRPGQRLSPLEAPEDEWVSPGFNPRDDWMTWQDTDGQLWVSRYDPLSGLPERDPSMAIIDDQLAPVRESRKGPEFIAWADSSLLTYVRTVEGALGIYGARFDGATWTTERLSPKDGVDRGGPIGTSGPLWDRPGLAFWRGDGEAGELCWTWLDGPEWEDHTLGPILSESTPVRWAPDGRHLIYTIAVAGTPQLFALDTESGQQQQLTSLPDGIVNPIAFLDPQTQSLVVGGVVSGAEIQLFRLDPGLVAVPLASRRAPARAVAEGYETIGSPEAFSFNDRVWVSAEVIRGAAGNVPDAQIWLLELRPSGAALDLRVDDGHPNTRRADPEFYFGQDEVFITYQRLAEGQGVRQDRVRSGLALFTRPNPLSIQSVDGALELRWNDAAEPKLMHSEDLLEWTELPPENLDRPITPQAPSGFFRLRPALD